MTGHLGTLARMIPVAPTASQAETTPPRFVVQEARDRRWAFDTGAHRPRSWSLAMGAMSTVEQRALSEVVAWGPGPWWWVSCAAHDVNVLTPRQSLLDGISGGPGDGVDGWSPVSHLGPSEVVLGTAPVGPGLPVTVSVEASGAATLTARLRDGAGTVVGQPTAVSVGSGMQRLTVTVPAPVAGSVDVVVSGHVRALRPQVTWTDGPRPWTVGRGASQVIVQSTSVDMLALSRAGAWWSGSVEILEVG